MRRSLTSVAVLACLAFVAALAPSPIWLRSALLIPLVLFLPGYAVSALLFPSGTIDATERGVYAVALSIAIAAVGGLVLQLAIGLDRDAWALLLSATTVIAAGRGLIASRGEHEPGRPAWRLPRLGAVAMLSLASLIAALAIASARNGLRDAQARVGFTDFWMVPVGHAEGQPSTDTLSLGLRSHEPAVTRYRLRILHGNRLLAVQALELLPGEQWERSFAVSSKSTRERVTATLSRQNEPYRNLHIDLER